MKKSFLLLFFLAISLQMAFAQSRKITGKVTDTKGESLPGVSIAVKGTTSGTISDVDGMYDLSVSGTNQVLEFTYIGFLKKEVPVGTQNVIDVVLSEDATKLSEVLVVGYGTVKKSQKTGAISSVGAKEIEELPVTNARQALQGRAAGVDVTIAGSKPGAGPQIRIRGRRSFNASNDPLYVVDGIPISGGIDDINPNDITSMEILKDASATAIYGSRGSNGVVIITTKRGKEGKTSISFDSYIGVNQDLGNIQVMNGEQFAEFKRESRRAIGQYPLGAATAADDAKIFEPVELAAIQSGKSTDYVNAMLRDGAIQSHQIGISGGTAKTVFNISGNFFKDVGVVKMQDFSRFTFRVNLDHNLNKNIKVGVSSLFVNSTRNGENFNPLGGAMAENPLGKPYNDDGTLNFLPTNDGLRTNPLAEIVPGAQVDETKRYRTFNSIYGEWSIIDGLKYRVNFGPDFTIGRNGRFIGSQTNERRQGAATASINESFVVNYTIENILTYNKKFNDVHNLNFTGLQSFQKDRFEASSISVLGVPAETQKYYRLGDASQITGANTNLIEWSLLSFMGRVNYDYKEKYLLTATLRADGSSRFGANTKFGYFPSVALGWNLHQEEFLSNVAALNSAKLRVSWGSIGNQAINPYQTQALLGRTSYAWDVNTAAFGYRPSTIGNPDLRWETSTTLNAGLDFEMFEGRFYGTIDAYVTTTSDLLAPQPLPPSTGFGGFITNIGKTQNKGIEFTFGSVNVDRNGFKWTTDLMLNSNREAILELANGKVDDIASGRFIGQPLTVFYDLRKIGIWQTGEGDAAAKFGDKVGQIKVEDINGRDASGKLTGAPDGKINADDRQILGSAVPKLVAGLTNRFSYKGVDLSFFLYGRFGQMVRSRFHIEQNRLAGRYNNLNIDYWTPNNPTNAYPQPVVTQEFAKYDGTMQYMDGSFIKIRNINLGYNVPSALSSKMKMESFRIFASIQQPYIFANYITENKGIDPETFVDGETGVGGGDINANITPATRIMTVGINVRF